MKASKLLSVVLGVVLSGSVLAQPLSDAKAPAVKPAQTKPEVSPQPIVKLAPEAVHANKEAKRKAHQAKLEVAEAKRHEHRLAVEAKHNEREAKREAAQAARKEHREAMEAKRVNREAKPK